MTCIFNERVFFVELAFPFCITIIMLYTVVLQSRRESSSSFGYWFLSLILSTFRTSSVQIYSSLRRNSVVREGVLECPFASHFWVHENIKQALFVDLPFGIFYFISSHLLYYNVLKYSYSIANGNELRLISKIQFWFSTRTL